MQHIVYLTIYKYIINTLFQYHDYNDIEAKVMKFHSLTCDAVRLGQPIDFLKCVKY